MASPPVATVYVHNLEERIRPDPLRDALHALFSEFGPVVDIIAKTNLKAKGQAFVVFENPEDAHRAVAEANGFVLFDKPMLLAMARIPSDATVAAAGDDDALEAHKRHRMAERDKKKALEAAAEEKRQQQRPDAAAAAHKPAAVPDEYLPPNKTLFVQNLPDDVGGDALTELFSVFPGFREVRVVPGRHLAFVEYEAEPGAIAAKERLAGVVVGEGDNKRPLKVTYQRR